MKIFAACLLLCIVVGIALANPQEVVTFTSNALTDPGIPRARVLQLHLIRKPPMIFIRVVECDASGAIADGAREAEFRYDGATAATLLGQLNTANLSIKSLERRVLERLQTDGFLTAGTFSGAP